MKGVGANGWSEYAERGFQNIYSLHEYVSRTTKGNGYYPRFPLLDARGVHNRQASEVNT